jgi:hypothetical protein
MADDTKPTVEEIRARWAAVPRGPWNVGDHGITAASGPAGVFSIVTALSEDEIDVVPDVQAALENAPVDVAFLLERDAARNARLADQIAATLEDRYATEERWEKTMEAVERGRVAMRTELDVSKARIAELEAELAAIRERARELIACGRKNIERVRDDDQLTAWLESETALIERVAALGESEKGGRDGT